MLGFQKAIRISRRPRPRWTIDGVDIALISYSVEFRRKHIGFAELALVIRRRNASVF